MRPVDAIISYQAKIPMNMDFEAIRDMPSRRYLEEPNFEILFYKLGTMEDILTCWSQFLLLLRSL